MAEELFDLKENINDEDNVAIKITGLKKRYRLGLITAGTLKGDLQSWWARKRGKEDPNLKIGAKVHSKNEVFMALDGIDLTIYKGERVGIIGHNGAGKSTLLKLLARVTGPTEGEIKIDGRITSMLEVGTGFNAELTGRENVYLNGAILGMTKAEVDRKMDQIIEFSECKQFIDTPVKRYSSGMFVKLAFSVAAHLDSEIMIMDEVLAVGDMAFQKKCLEKMSEVSKDEGRTILYVSHNMNTIRQLCSRCIVLNHGKVIFNGDVEEAINIYLGTSANEFPVKYDLTNADRPSAFHGSKIFIKEIVFNKPEQAVFERNEKISFDIKFDAKSDIENVKAYFVVFNNKGEPVGTTQTCEKFCDVKAGENYSFNIELDLSNLVSGDYSMRADIFSDNNDGRHLSYDRPNTYLSFKIVEKETKGILWNKRYLGYVELNSPVIKSK